MCHLLISVEKRLDTRLATQIGELGQKRNQFLVVHLYATMGVDIEEGLIDLFLVDALEVEAQLARFHLLHNSNYFNVNTMQVRILRVQK